MIDRSGDAGDGELSVPCGLSPLTQPIRSAPRHADPGGTTCFAAGTRILTPYRDMPVQDLRPGDEVLTLRSGAEAVQKIIWTGHRRLDITRHAQPEKVTPVRIMAGALGGGLPETDLLLSPDHCLYFDGWLIEAKTLINGATVRQDSSQRIVSYHHFELARHDIVLAEGVPAETYLSHDNRTMFGDSGALTLHPDFANASRQNAIAPLAIGGQVVRHSRQRLLERAFAMGFTVTELVDLRLKASLETIRPEPGSTPSCLIFELGHKYRNVELCSSAGIPAHLRPDQADHRKLGAAITGLYLVTDRRRTKIALNDPSHQGFHAMEKGFRWTNGAAKIALPPYDSRAFLEVRLRGQAPRWAPPNRGAVATG